VPLTKALSLTVKIIEIKNLSLKTPPRQQISCQKKTEVDRREVRHLRVSLVEEENTKCYHIINDEKVGVKKRGGFTSRMRTCAKESITYICLHNVIN